MHGSDNGHLRVQLGFAAKLLAPGSFLDCFTCAAELSCQTAACTLVAVAKSSIAAEAPAAAAWPHNRTGGADGRKL